jgi:hypothetical protein
VGAADPVIEHVHAFRQREPLEPRLEVLGLVVDALVGAMLAGEGKLVSRRGDGDDARSHQLGDLDGGNTGPSRGAEHRDAFFGFELGTVLQGMQRRAVGDWDPRRNLIAHALRDGNDVLRLGDHLLPAAIAADIGHHPLPDLEIGDACAQPLDGAGDLRSRRERERRRDLVLVAEQ